MTNTPCVKTKRQIQGIRTINYEKRSDAHIIVIIIIQLYIELYCYLNNTMEAKRLGWMCPNPASCYHRHDSLLYT